MKQNSIKLLFSESAVYSAGLILSRAISFILLPLYTHVFTESDYGVISMIYTFLGIMGIVLYYGVDAALLKFYIQAPEKKRTYYTTVYLLLLLTTTMFLGAGLLLRHPLAGIVLRIDNPDYLVLCLFILFFDVLHRIPTMILRAENRPVVYTLLTLLNVALTLSLNILFVVKMNLGVTGVLYGNLAASGALLLLTIPITVKLLRPGQFSGKIVYQTLNFGFPLMYSFFLLEPLK